MSWTPWLPPQLPEYDPSQSEVTREHGLYPTQLETRPEGYKAMPADAGSKLEQQGWWQCPTTKDRHGKPCDFWLSPQAHQTVKNNSGYLTCPKCRTTADLLADELPWHGVADEVFGNTSTHVGIPPGDQGQIGENLVAQLGDIPGYGPITWWHPGGAESESALDGATAEWGIEVKSLAYDALNHKFDPGRGKRANPQQYFESKNRAAAAMGLKGVLGILVMLDFRRDVADIYAKAMPLEPWEALPGVMKRGIAAFHKGTAEKLVAEVPFTSPYKDPNSPTPGPFMAEDYYQRPQVAAPPGQEVPESNEPAPF